MRYILLFLLLFEISYSHPHVFFDTSFDVVIEKNILSGIEIELELDELNTKLNQKVFKLDEDMNVDESSIIFLKKILPHIRVIYGDKNYSKDDLIFEQAKLEGDNLKIFFFLSTDEKIEENKKLKISVYDKKYYYNYDYNNNSLKFKYENTDYKEEMKFFTNKKISFYFNLIHPQEYEVIFK